MKRRNFIKGAAVSATLPFWLQNCNLVNRRINYPISLHSDYNSGHLLMESENWPRIKNEKIDLVIVGSGIAGLSAAFANREKNYKLFELSNRLGGTSGSSSHSTINFSQGAHYDLAYPEYYGQEVLHFLEKLDVIHYQPWKKAWTFTDDQHIIPFQRRQKCYDNGDFRGDMIPDGPFKEQFRELMLAYTGKMPLPTRLASEEIKSLNNITFLGFLSTKLTIDESMQRRLDYHMMDDYGGRCNEISAFAGIHYFACRPYYKESVDLFSPPTGNYYFIKKIAEQLDMNAVSVNHLVKKIERQGNEHYLEILDINNKKIIEIYSEQVIYAGQKHALKYIFPNQYELFKNDYAPWMVINIICKDISKGYGYWQNEYLGENPSFLGFIDSSIQDKSSFKGYRVFSAYYCLKSGDREYLTTIEEKKEDILSETQGYVEHFIGEKIIPEAAYINVMGHAMPIPKTGYLFNDANNHPNAKMHYAGVDNGRLPLLYEAIDSGLLTSY